MDGTWALGSESTESSPLDRQGINSLNSFLRISISVVYMYYIWFILSSNNYPPWLLWIMSLWTLVYRYLFESLLSILLNLYLEVELLHHILHTVFPQGLRYFASSPAMHKGSNFSTSLPTLVILFFDNSHHSGCELHCGFNLHVYGTVLRIFSWTYGTFVYLFWRNVCIYAKLLQSCPTLCSPIHCSPPGSSIYGILQARIMQWIAMPSSRGSSPPRDWTCGSYISCICGQVLYPLTPSGKP